MYSSGVAIRRELLRLPVERVPGPDEELPLNLLLEGVDELRVFGRIPVERLERELASA